MTNHAIENAKDWYAEIQQWLETGDERAIAESALALDVRSGWYRPSKPTPPEEYQITLTFGGPSLRIIGDLDIGAPATARMEWADYDTPWTEYREADPAVLVRFASHFYFGE